MQPFANFAVLCIFCKGGPQPRLLTYQPCQPAATAGMKKRPRLTAESLAKTRFRTTAGAKTDGRSLAQLGVERVGRQHRLDLGLGGGGNLLVAQVTQHLADQLADTA